MADLFDIANLITTVGVDAVKIKPEPGLPEKSSNEILTELFSTFDVDGSVASPDEDDDDQKQKETTVEDEKKDKTPEKKKKSKKKHKHKDKKHKKKSKHNSSDSSDEENSGTKKKKKHKKKSKRKHEADSNKSSDCDETKVKKAKLENLPANKFSKKNVDDHKSSKINAVPETLLDKKDNRRSSSPLLPPITKKIDDENDDSIIPKVLEKSKSGQGKIQIKDLKNSVVYNEVVKEIENKEKQKAARMEDGEISDSNNDSGTPTLSPTPPPRKDSYRTPSLSPTPNSVKMSSRNDLRLVLREKEKKRLEIVGKSRTRDDKDYRQSRSRRSRGHADANNRGSKRSHSCHLRDRKRSESQSRTNSHRSRSGGRERWRDGSSERRGRSHERKESGRSRDRRRDRSRSTDRYSRGARSRSRQRKERIEIDKKKLLEIARRNAINMIKQGTLPLAQQDKAIAAIQAGGKTVDELTDFCKSLSKSEALGELSSISSEEDGSGSEKGFHHPFLLKERPSSIIMNIKDAKQLPTKTFQEKAAESSNQLRLQFPVSSGQLHRKTESEWIPVSPKKAVPKKAFVPATAPPEPLAIMPPPVSLLTAASTPTPTPALAPTARPVIPQSTVFPPLPTEEPMDIGTIVSQRLAAMRKLRENPHDMSALNEIYRAQNEMKTWAKSKQMPGQFTGSTGVKVLTPAELTSGYQAWARKDQLVSAQPVSGGMGMALLQKMGWRPGEGLGKNKEGTLVPLQLEVKLDKKGLVSEEDVTQKVHKQTKPIVPTVKTLEGKHPVSLLGEYCSKRRLGAPVYELCFESGPDHKKNFLFKVKVNGIEYKPTVASPNKKQAKYEAAQVCLQILGLLPS